MAEKKTFRFNVIYPEGAQQTCSVDWRTEPRFLAICNVVTPYLGGRRFEHVTVLHNGKRADMFVDECGAINRLPMNIEATDIYRAASMRANPDQDPDSLPAIYGVAVLFDERVWF